MSTHHLQYVVEGLNEKQKQAVTSPANGILQIIAGPGTGKTKVLISRVAYLLLIENIPPEKIIVTTFTKKAANEIVDRLQPLVAKKSLDLSKMLIGTFHSISYRIIRRYGGKLGLNNYSIADERDSSQVLQECLKDMSAADMDYLSGLPEEEVSSFKTGNDLKYHGYDPKAIKNNISKLKSNGLTVDQYKEPAKQNRALLYFYSTYQSRLQKLMLLDFDDCLLECHRLVSQYPVLNFVQHVLVDEFQDTNEIQLRLTFEFAKGHPTCKTLQNNITIVGDPDQSIYGFRDAQAANFQIMAEYCDKRLHKKCQFVTLDENYRSTSDILSISERIMKQQKDRITKTLHSQHRSSFKPVHTTLGSSIEEAKWIVYQIKYLTSLPGSLFKYLDIAVLVRSAFQTRLLENEFVRMKVPYFMVRGKAFWERKEVVAILDYLRVVANPNDKIAYTRTLMIPKKGIGEKTMDGINKYLNSCDYNIKTVHEYLQTYAAGQPSKLSNTIITHLELISTWRNELKLFDGCNDVDILSSLFETIYLQSGLKKEFEEDEDRETNIMEVQKQLIEFEPQEEEVELYIGGTEEEIAKDDRNFLAKFVTSLELYEVTESQEQEKVALSTIHGSKGLEWPVVFVPGLSEGVLPSNYSLQDDTGAGVDEERRCFYVATTRAKCLLFLSSVIDTVENSSWRKPLTDVSRFVANLSHHCTASLKCFQSWEILQTLYKIRNLTGDESFDLKLFNLSYKNKLKAYLKNELNTIDPFDYQEVETSFTSFAPTITTAKSHINTSFTPQVKRLYDEIMEARKNLAKKLKNGSRLSKPFKAPSARLDSKENRAPAYTKAEIIAPQGKKAPAYIPNRRKP